MIKRIIIYIIIEENTLIMCSIINYIRSSQLIKFKIITKQKKKNKIKFILNTYN